MLIHDPEESPQVAELGFQAGPGVFTSVAFSLEKVSFN